MKCIAETFFYNTKPRPFCTQFRSNYSYEDCDVVLSADAACSQWGSVVYLNGRYIYI